MSLNINLIKPKDLSGCIFIPLFAESLKSTFYKSIGINISSKVSSYKFEGLFLERLNFLSVGPSGFAIKK